MNLFHKTSTRRLELVRKRWRSDETSETGTQIIVANVPDPGCCPNRDLAGLCATAFRDSRLLNQAPLSQTVNENGPAINPFTQPQLMIINLAAGAIPPGHCFPARLLVDYVRVYQRVPAS